MRRGAATRPRLLWPRLAGPRRQMRVALLGGATRERVRAAAEHYPELEVEISEPLGFHERIVDVVLERLGALP